MLKPVLVDVGGLGGLGPEWHALQGQITPVFFEPNKEEADHIRPKIEKELGGIVAAHGLGSADGHHILNITASAGCTSLLIPNDEFLKDYSVHQAFEIRRRTIVECTRYDTLHENGVVPEPDIIKIDVQGFEYEVLRGFGSLLEKAAAIEMEAHFQPLYVGQKLLHDYVSYLGDRGFALRKIQPVPHFDGYVVEVNVWFTKSPSKIDSLSSRKRAALDLAEKAWELPMRGRNFSPGCFNET